MECVKTLRRKAAARAHHVMMRVYLKHHHHRGEFIAGLAARYTAGG